MVLVSASGLTPEEHGGQHMAHLHRCCLSPCREMKPIKEEEAQHQAAKLREDHVVEFVVASICLNYGLWSFSSHMNPPLASTPGEQNGHIINVTAIYIDPNLLT